MRFLFGLTVVFLSIIGLLCGTGIGVGYFLHWIVPSIGLDMGTLIGVVSMGWTISIFARLMNYSASIQEVDDQAESLEVGDIVITSSRSRRSTKRKKNQ